MSLLDAAAAAASHCLSAPDRFIRVFCLLENMPQHRKTGKLKKRIGEYNYLETFFLHICTYVPMNSSKEEDKGKENQLEILFM